MTRWLRFWEGCRSSSCTIMAGEYERSSMCVGTWQSVVQAPGRRSSLQRPYHGWTYGLSGALQGAPRVSASPASSRPPWSASGGGGVVRSTGVRHLATKPMPLLDDLGPAPDWLRSAGIDLEDYRWAYRREYDLQANWKVFTENSLECYHCPGVHPTINEFMLIGPDDFKILPEGNVIQMEAPYRAVVKPEGGHSPSESPATYPYVFPNLHLFTFNDGTNSAFNVQTWIPDGPDRTALRNDYFFTSGTTSTFREDYTGFYDQVVYEDKPIVEGVHAGMRSGVLTKGRLLLDSEHGIRHFNDLLRAALGDAAAVSRQSPAMSDAMRDHGVTMTSLSSRRRASRG